MKTKILAVIVILALGTAAMADVATGGADMIVDYLNQMRPHDHEFIGETSDTKMTVAKTEIVQFPINNAKKLLIDKGISDIRIVGGGESGDFLEVKVDVLLPEDMKIDSSTAKKRLERAKLTAKNEVSTMTLSVKDLRGHDDGVTVAVEIVIPKNLQLEIDNRYGDIRIENYPGIVKLKKDGGNLELVNCGGVDGRIKEFGTVNAKGIQQLFRLDMNRGDVTLDNAKGNVEIIKERGNVTVQNVEGDVVVESVRGILNVQHVKGNVTIDTEYGKATLNDISGEIHND